VVLQIIVPFKLEGAKSRLSPALSTEERRLFALAMLHDVLQEVSGIGQVTILSRPGLKGPYPNLDPNIIESDLGLNDAINSLLEDRQKEGLQSDLLVVMSDLSLITRKDVEGIMSTPGDVVLSPGRGGGTNMILVRESRFRTCYRGLSFLKHRDLASELGLEVGIYASYRSGCDIDEPDDLAEVLIHGHGRAKMLLEKLGFELCEDKRGKYARRLP
jgi:2-phospho-L-lactate/phosphoenolpyruvate guanylyltransferase